MLFIRGLHNLKKQKEKSIITIGNFDGVHLGHQEIIKRMRVQSQAEQLAIIIIIFEPQPKEYFMGASSPQRIMPLREKIKILKKLGVDKVVCLYFNHDLEMLSPKDFIEKIIVQKLQAKYVWAGEDFRFGYKQQGDVRLLEKLGEVYDFQVKLMPSVFLENSKISSTLVRELLQRGQMEKAAFLLGRPFCLSGRVMRGDGRGRKIGFPTANIRFSFPLVGGGTRKADKGCLWLALSLGVYAVKVILIPPVGESTESRGGLRNLPELYGVANMGTRPTFQGVNTVLEVHLFNFSNDLYNRHLNIEFIHKLRYERRFESVDALKAQIAQDIAQAKAYFKIAN